MAVIKLDDNALKTRSAELSARIAELQNLNARLESLINRIDASWEGQSSIAYITTMRGYAERANKMVEVLTEYKKYVDTVLERIPSHDNISSNRIRGSF